MTKLASQCWVGGENRIVSIEGFNRRENWDSILRLTCGNRNTCYTIRIQSQKTVESSHGQSEDANQRPPVVSSF